MLRLEHATKFVAPKGRTVIFGVVNPGDLGDLIIPHYQRQILPVRSVAEWREAFSAGEVPPIELGSQQRRCTVGNEGRITIPGDVHIIDGLQRRTAARLIHNQGGTVWLLATVYLGTTDEWEVGRFRTLNGQRRQVSTCVLLRNIEETNAAIGVLRRLSVEERTSVLSGRVQWDQNPKPGNLLTAVSLVKVVALLHAHFGTGLRNNKAEQLAWSLSDVVDVISPEVCAANVETFFRIIGSTIDIERVQSSRRIVQLTLGYLLSLAAVLGGHADFWRDGRLVLTDAARDALVKVGLDSIEVNTIASLGRPSNGLVMKLAGVVKPRRGALTPW